MITIIHKYRDYKIEKVENYYFQGKEVYYRCDGIHFERLKDAKKYIDIKEDIKQ